MFPERMTTLVHFVFKLRRRPLLSFPSPLHLQPLLDTLVTSSLRGHSHGLGHSVQASTFISLPGAGAPAKKREFYERRLMGYSMDQMFEVVSDVEHYKDFLPWCESSKVKSSGRGHIAADLVIGMKPVTESYTSSVTLFRPHLIRAESTQGRHFNTMLTQWKFTPGLKGKPNSCIVDFYVCLEFKSLLHSQIANVFFNEVVRAMAGAFFNEAKKRFGPESVPSRKIAIVPSSGSSSSGKMDDPP